MGKPLLHFERRDQNDVDRWLAYRAEWATEDKVGTGPFLTLDECAHLTARIFNRPEFRARALSPIPLHFRRSGTQDAPADESKDASSARHPINKWGNPVWGMGTIALHASHQHVPTLLHELAHSLCPPIGQADCPCGQAPCSV